MRHSLRFHGSLLSLVGPLGALEATALADPQVVNPGFEDDGTGVASPIGWQSGGSVDADYTEWGGHTGNYRLSHWSAAAYSVDTQQMVKNLEPGSYTLRAWVRRSTGLNNGYIALQCDDRMEKAYLPIAWASQWLQIVVSSEAHRGQCTITLHTDAAAGEWSNFDDIELVRAESRLSVLGADVSSLAKSEDLGGVYYDEQGGSCNRHASALDILKGHGMNAIRLRVWVNSPDGYHNQAEIAEMARRCDARGLDLFIDLHYSDTWADPGQQSKPAAWASYTPAQLADAVYQHTYAVCEAAKVHGRAPAMVQLGNEINSGMLWPDGSTWNPPNWDNLATFLKAGYAAVKACSPRTKVVLHLANGGDNGAFRWWFDNITSQGVQFDVIAASYYGYWHGSLGDLQQNLNDVSARYSKDVLVAETAYPFTLSDADGWPNTIATTDQLVAGYSATPLGQAANFRDVLSIVRAVPNGRGLGAFYWDATWTAVKGNGWDPSDPSSGNAWENQALFDFTSHALPAVEAFRR